MGDQPPATAAAMVATTAHWGGDGGKEEAMGQVGAEEELDSMGACCSRRLSLLVRFRVRWERA